MFEFVYFFTNKYIQSKSPLLVNMTSTEHKTEHKKTWNIQYGQHGKPLFSLPHGNPLDTQAKAQKFKIQNSASSILILTDRVSTSVDFEFVPHFKVCPQNRSMGDFVHQIRSKYKFPSHEAIIWYVYKPESRTLCVPSMGDSLTELVHKYADTYGVLHIRYGNETAFGHIN